MIKAKKQLDITSAEKALRIKTEFSTENQITLYNGNWLDFLRTISNKSIQVIVTSSPYNVGKPYEKKLKLESMLYNRKKL